MDCPAYDRRRLAGRSTATGARPRGTYQPKQQGKRMRSIMAAGALALGIAATPAYAQAPDPSQLLQGLLSGNRGQDQSLRDAFERGYRHGREDQARADRDRGPPPGPGYPDPGRDPRGYPPPGPGPYGR